jgi:hypothetical protein
VVCERLFLSVLLDYWLVFSVLMELHCQFDKIIYSYYCQNKWRIINQKFSIY